MFRVFTLALILATLAALEARSPAVDAIYKCHAEFGVTGKEVEELFQILPHGTEGIERKYKCYAKCLMDELNYKDENGKMDFKRVANNHHGGTENALNVTADCEAKHDLETDECERTFKIFACIAITVNPRIYGDKVQNPE